MLISNNEMNQIKQAFRDAEKLAEKGPVDGVYNGINLLW